MSNAMNPRLTELLNGGSANNAAVHQYKDCNIKQEVVGILLDYSKSNQEFCRHFLNGGFRAVLEGLNEKQSEQQFVYHIALEVFSGGHELVLPPSTVDEALKALPQLKIGIEPGITRPMEAFNDLAKHVVEYKERLQSEGKVCSFGKAVFVTDGLATDFFGYPNPLENEKVDAKAVERLRQENYTDENGRVTALTKDFVEMLNHCGHDREGFRGLFPGQKVAAPRPFALGVPGTNSAAELKVLGGGNYVDLVRAQTASDQAMYDEIVKMILDVSSSSSGEKYLRELENRNSSRFAIDPDILKVRGYSLVDQA